MREEEIHQTDIYHRRPLKSWGEGRVTLAGDAAHPMTFNMGQGACQGIEDALELARCLAADDDVPAALQRYEELRIPRTTKFTKLSSKIAWIGLFKNPVAYRIRKLMLGNVGRNVERGEKLLKFDTELPARGAAAD